ncbi:hypothetical protein [Kribbella sp. NPDC048928]|uniref:hypothetical protein n=1 Tax=Kribbella sp. NPDC048928 TaxID=3364111 RepID=UPI00371EB45B
MRRLVLLLAATIFLLTGTAHAATPTDTRITGAVAAWAHEPLYVDPDFSTVVDRSETLQVISGQQVPVFVAVVPTGEWFPEKGDAELLAGRLAAANGKPGVYVVTDGDRTYGVANQLAVYAPSWTYGTGDDSVSKQLAAYLDGVEQTKHSTPEPARTTPTPPPGPPREYPEEKFTVGSAIGNGVAGSVVGLIGGGFLGGIVLIVAAIATPRRRKERA